MAIKICKAAEPKHIIPMHYRTEKSGYLELATVEEFLKLAEENNMNNNIFNPDTIV